MAALKAPSIIQLVPPKPSASPTTTGSTVATPVRSPAFHAGRAESSLAACAAGRISGPARLTRPSPQPPRARRSPRAERHQQSRPLGVDSPLAAGLVQRDGNGRRAGVAVAV